MRGKKSDPKFISDFIQQCVTNLGIHTSDDIVSHAKFLIQEIDEEIKNIEKKKITRSKLLDVIMAFEKSNKDKTEEAKLLPFFNLQYPQVCFKLCKEIAAKPLNENYSILGLKEPEILFCIKQLIETKIISRIENSLIRGDRFNEYMTFVLREVQ